MIDKRKVVSFKLNVNFGASEHLKNLTQIRKKSEFINKAIELKYFYDKSRIKFLFQMLEYNFDICKHLLRKIGRAKKRL